MTTTSTLAIDPNDRGYVLVLHGGAGGRLGNLSDAELGDYRAGLRDAYAAGETLLASGASAVDAVCAAVCRLEDNPLFNAGRGAALTGEGTVELDALVMNGAGRAGAVTNCSQARHPVLAARAVMEHTAHVLLSSPSASLLAGWGLETVDPHWFVTDARIAQLERVRAGLEAPLKHGTVGAAALDRAGHLAAATSTGGISGKAVGRVGDTPVVGAGTFAHDGVVALSCTGVGEAFLQGVVAHDVYARMAYAGQPLPVAVNASLTQEVAVRGADGGLVAVGADGRVVVAHNSPMMYAAWRDGDTLRTQV